MSTADTRGLGTRTVRGMAWAYGSYVGGRLLVLASTAVLARLLTPGDFGLVALALTFMTLLDGVSDLGLSDALVIQKRELLHERAETVFVSGIAVGIALSLLVVAISPLVASFFDEPELLAITAVLGSNFVLKSLGVTHYALAQKDLDFRARTVAEFSEVAVRGTVGIVLAVSGLGVWSLVIGYLAGSIALDVAIWRMVPWRPRLQPKREHIRPLLGFGSTISAVSLIATVMGNLDYLFVGGVLGATSLGLYTIGFRIPELLIGLLAAVAGQVVFPAFAAVRGDDLRRAFLISLRYTTLLALPITVALVVLAEPLILVAFGDQWTESIDITRIVSVYALAQALGVPAGMVYKATGRAGVLLAIAVPALVALTVLLVLFTDRGIEAAALSHVVVALAAGLVNTVLSTRLLAVSFTALGRSIAPAVAAAACMTPPMVAAALLIDLPVVALAVGGVAGAAVYLGALMLFAPDAVRYIVERFRATETPVDPEEAEAEAGAVPATPHVEE